MPAGVATGTVTSVTGIASAHNKNGNMRPLLSGDTVHNGEYSLPGSER